MLVGQKLNKIMSLFKLLRYKIIYRNRFKFSSWSGIYIGRNSHFVLNKGARISIENKFTMRSDVILNLNNNAVVILKDGVFINNGCKVNCHQFIQLGENSLLGEYVLIYDHDHSIFHHNRKNIFNVEPVFVGEDVWIGSHCVVTKGVTIGKGSVIGALNCIRVNIAENSLVRSINDIQVIDYD